MGLFTKDDPARKRLDELTAIVTQSIAGFTQAGAALAMIRNEGLYKLTHTSFADFVEHHWGIKARRAYQLITAAATAANVQNFAHAPNEHQAAALSTVAPEQQPAVWQQVIDQAPRAADGTPQITAEGVAEVASAYRRRPKRSRVNKPAAIRLRGKGWKITLERTSLTLDALTVIDQAREQLLSRQVREAA